MEKFKMTVGNGVLKVVRDTHDGLKSIDLSGFLTKPYTGYSDHLGVGVDRYSKRSLDVSFREWQVCKSAEDEKDFYKITLEVEVDMLIFGNGNILRTGSSRPAISLFNGVHLTKPGEQEIDLSDCLDIKYDIEIHVPSIVGCFDDGDSDERKARVFLTFYPSEVMWLRTKEQGEG